MPSRNPFDLRVKIILVLSQGSYQIMMSVVPDTSGEAADRHVSNHVAPTCSMKVKDPPIFKTTPVTHDLYRGDNAADEPQPAIIA